MPPVPLTPIALFGGAFDPVHAGHLGVIDFLRSEGGFSEVWVLPTSDLNPKGPQASARDRLACLAIALELEKGKRPGVRIESIEAGSPGSRSATHFAPRFTTDTLRELGRPRDEITFVIGNDQFASLHAWKNFPEVLGQCHWLILERPGVQSEAVRQALSRYEIEGVLRRDPTIHEGFKTSENAMLRFQPVRTMEISSTAIRRELALEGALRAPDRLPPGVDAYLMRHKLYGRTS